MPLLFRQKYEQKLTLFFITERTRNLILIIFRKLYFFVDFATTVAEVNVAD